MEMLLILILAFMTGIYTGLLMLKQYKGKWVDISLSLFVFAALLVRVISAAPF